MAVAQRQLDLGVSLARSGAYGEAAAAFRSVLAIDPRSLSAHVNLGTTFAAQGQLGAAIDSYRTALRIAPNAAAVHFKLAAALRQHGRLDEAILSYATSIALEPSVAGFNDLGSALRERGRLDDAIAAYRNAIRLDAGAALVQVNLGTALEDKGWLEDATRCYERALELDPGLTMAHRALGMVLVERGLVDEGFAHFRRFALLNRARRGVPAPGTLPSLKQKHEREQAAYLRQTGADRGQTDPSACRYGERLAFPAVNPINDTAGIETAWARSAPKIVVVDNLLTPDALEGLRRFCWRSTIWNTTYGGGYLGAFPEDGFAPPLLAQISRELRAKFQSIFRDLPLKLWWAFTCDSGVPGIGIHADFAAVNVNFWITPDEANLDPESGGLVIWDVPAPLGWDYQKYNADSEAIRGFLSRSQAKSVTVPYRANRAVIFDSDLFHATDRAAFKAGYLNRRINITLLYGLREHRSRGSHPARGDAVLRCDQASAVETTLS
jgi:tetratricopeptide (TPR) repeat protein